MQGVTGRVSRYQMFDPYKLYDPFLRICVENENKVYFSTSRLHNFEANSNLKKKCNTFPSGVLLAIIIPNFKQLSLHLVPKLLV